MRGSVSERALSQLQSIVINGDGDGGNPDCGKLTTDVDSSGAMTVTSSSAQAGFETPGRTRKGEYIIVSSSDSHVITASNIVNAKHKCSLHMTVVSNGKCPTGTWTYGIGTYRADLSTPCGFDEIVSQVTPIAGQLSNWADRYLGK